MQLGKYRNLIILIFSLNIISNSSANEWKKLKRRLIALGLLHSIRVKTIIPVPLPVPLPVVVRKVSNPVVLPPKKVPFLVPKPVPVFQIIPKFVPVYKESKSKSPAKLWSDGDSDSHLLTAQTTSHEDYLRPTFDTKIDYELIGKLTNDYLDKPQYMALSSFNDFNKYSLLDTDNSANNIDLSIGKKLFRKNRRPKKQKRNKMQDIFNSQQLSFGDLSAEDLLMLSSQPKTKPEATNPYTDQIRAKANQKPKNSDQSVSSPEMRPKQMSNGVKNRKEMIENVTSRVAPTGPSMSARGQPSVKKVKVGELRIRANQMKDLLRTHRQNG